MVGFTFVGDPSFLDSGLNEEDDGGGPEVSWIWDSIFSVQSSKRVQRMECMVMNWENGFRIRGVRDSVGIVDSLAIVLCNGGPPRRRSNVVAP